MAKCRLLAKVETALLGMAFAGRIQASGTFIVPIEARASYSVRCPEIFPAVLTIQPSGHQM